MLDILFENEKIKLRKATEKDADAMKDLLKDPDVMLYYGQTKVTHEYALNEIR